MPDIEKLLEIMEGEQYFYNQISEKYVYSLIIIHFICNNVAIICFQFILFLYSLESGVTSVPTNCSFKFLIQKSLNPGKQIFF